MYSLIVSCLFCFEHESMAEVQTVDAFKMCVVFIFLCKVYL